MAGIDPEARFHRTLGRMPRGTEVGNRSALTFAGPQLVPVWYVLTESRDFRRHATDWEKSHSAILHGAGSGHAVPIVDANIMVVGYLGEFRSKGEIYVPRHTKQLTNGQWDLQALVNSRVPILAHARFKHPSAYNPVTKQKDFVVGRVLDKLGLEEFGAPQTVYKLVTDPDGRVAWVMSARSSDGVEAHWASPFDLLIIPKLATMLGGKIIGAISRRIFGNAAAGAVQPIVGRIVDRIAERPVGGITVGEMEQYLTEVLVQRPELGILMRARSLSGEALQREALAALQEWQYLYGRNVKWVENGVVQELTGTPRNFMTLRGNELWVEKQITDVARREVQVWTGSIGGAPGARRELLTQALEEGRTKQHLLFEETTHELAADALAGRGGIFDTSSMAYIAGRDFKRTNAMELLENAIQAGGAAPALQFFR